MSLIHPCQNQSETVSRDGFHDREQGDAYQHLWQYRAHARQSWLGKRPPQDLLTDIVHALESDTMLPEK